MSTNQHYRNKDLQLVQFLAVIG